MAQRYPTISIVGAGTVGTTLGLALRAKGYPVASVIRGIPAWRLAWFL